MRMETVDGLAIENIAQDGDKNIDTGIIGISKRFAILNRLISRDLNKATDSPVFSRYTKSQIQEYISNPSKYEKNLRKAVVYLYGASSHFRRLIQYFVSLSDLSYIVEPYKIDPKKTNKRILNNNYRKVLSMLSSMNIKTQVAKILTVCLREDVFYGTLWVGSDNITIQQLPSDFCAISTVEGNVPNVDFDFSYFNTRPEMLEYFPEEFKVKYAIYKQNRRNRWIELSSPYSFAIKCNMDTLEYAVPPFAGILREIYDIEDYKSLKLTKTALENYAMLYMKLPMLNDGSWAIDLKKAKKFWDNLDAVLPDEIGSVLSPMDIEKIDFERHTDSDESTVASAEQNLFTAAGVSSLLFNNQKASANALTLSIKADQEVTYGIVKSVEDALNRFIQSQSYGKNFKINFLDISPYNRKEMSDAFLKAASYGLPTISAYAAANGIGQAEMDGMSFLEAQVLNLQSLFKPLISSSQMSATSEGGDSKGATDEGGAPEKDIDELSESGEQNREDA